MSGSRGLAGCSSEVPETTEERDAHGDFGLGTFEALDGEMVALDGEYYQIRADGRAYPVDGQTKTPFAVVTLFEPSLSETLGTTNLAALCKRVDRLSGDASVCCGVRVDGHFGYVRTRSVPRQRKPYPPLVEVVKNQPVFELHDVSGSLVGFKFPDYAQGLNVAGYHFHFITADRSAGGHVLECRLRSGELRLDQEADLQVELPSGVGLPVPDRSSAKRETLDRIEGDRPYRVSNPPLRACIAPGIVVDLDLFLSDVFLDDLDILDDLFA